jgi:Fe-S-cluster-containing dehydrogenase component
MASVSLEIEHSLCWGCKTCEVACKQEHRMPDGVKLIFITEDGPHKVSGKFEFTYRVNVCRHCDEPPCEEACPDEAIYKRKDGIVVLSSEICSGCQICLSSCPFEAISFDVAEGTARKCNLCYQRVDNGLYPACADNICLAHCIHFKTIFP